ncbi:lipoprotein YcdR [Escherichia coli]|nr:lipoprotein YcdR [Escherichia coli]
MLRNGNKYLLMLVSIIMLTACISQSRTSFIPPQDRESLLAEQPWPHNGFVAISWHNVEDEAAGNDSNLLIVFYVQIMPDDFVMQLHRF